jgi:hypothetical protein
MDLSHTSVSILGMHSFRHCSSLRLVLLPPTLARLLHCAFAGCGKLLALDLSGGAGGEGLVTEVPRGCFLDCAELRQVAFPGALALLWDDAFAGCGSLAAADLSGTALREIGDRTFEGCGSLTDVKVPATLADIGERAFAGCLSLAAADLKHTAVSELPAGAFLGCAKLWAAPLPPTLRRIGPRAFAGCGELRNIRLTEPAAGDVTGDQPKPGCGVHPTAYENCGGIGEALGKRGYEGEGALHRYLKEKGAE